MSSLTHEQLLSQLRPEDHELRSFFIENKINEQDLVSLTEKDISPFRAVLQFRYLKDNLDLLNKNRQLVDALCIEQITSANLTPLQEDFLETTNNFEAALISSAQNPMLANVEDSPNGSDCGLIFTSPSVENVRELTIRSHNKRLKRAAELAEKFKTWPTAFTFPYNELSERIRTKLETKTHKGLKNKEYRAVIHLIITEIRRIDM
jgi:hypothetical protein